MVQASELINDNGISAIALAFFTAMFAAIGGMARWIYQLIRKADDAKEAADLAAEEAKKTQNNTAGLANGFAGSVGAKLDSILAKQDRLEEAFRGHLEHHLEHDSQRRR
jgi:hypothetical protein